MRSHSQMGRGFTLGEVLATLVIVAVLAAVMVPAIASQLDKGVVGRASEELVNLRAGTQAFVMSVQRMPASVAQLTRRPVPGVDTALVGGTYTTEQASRWKGPYVRNDSAGALHTAFGAAGLNDFALVAASEKTYLTYLVPGIDTASALALDRLMDDGNPQFGSIRCATTSRTGRCTLEFLVLAEEPTAPSPR